MNKYAVIGRHNRQTIINYLELADNWQTVKQIAAGTKNRYTSSIYCHCDNLATAGILEKDRILIEDRLTWIYRFKHH
jgi:hypothetical protein